MNCEGCVISPQGQQISFEAAKIKALEFAIQNNVSVAVYADGFNWKIMEAFAAYNAGLGPSIGTVVSKHR